MSMLPAHRGAATVLLASNRGPVSFATAEDGSLTVRRGGGGLVSGLAAAAGGDRTVWVCTALTDADRQAATAAPAGRLDLAGHDTGGPVRMLAIDPTTLSGAYDGVANSTLWFTHHLLFDLAVSPSFDAEFRRDWSAYRTYNTDFAEALAAEAAPGARVLVQDYHLALTPRQLRERRPDLRIGHFTHTPWAPPDYYRLLPDDVARAVLLGMLGAHRAAFLSRRWAAAFLDCCRVLLGAQVDEAAGTVTLEGWTTRIGVHPLGVDAAVLRERAARRDVAARRQELREAVGERRLLVRLDRTELSKNVLRGLAAYRELLRGHPEWVGQVVHLAIAYPSRQSLPAYRAYTAAVARLAEEINVEFARPGWTPLLLALDDDYAASLAACLAAEVLVVNPIRDGMNLVAKEGPVLAETGCALVLSREAGAADELADDALMVNPYDVAQTAAAMHAALLLAPAERAVRSARLAAAAAALPPQTWLADQLAALD